MHLFVIYLQEIVATTVCMYLSGNVFDMARERYPLINRLHVFRDGAATQYKQKGNFDLFSKEPFKKVFKDISWNLFEASHGKGALNGVGGSLKRSTNKIVHQLTKLSMEEISLMQRTCSTN